jgi:cytochrome c biogenesis factor
MHWLGRPRLVGLAILAVLTAAFLTYLATAVPVRSVMLPRAHAYDRWQVLAASIALILVVDTATVVLYFRRRRRMP